MKKLLIVSAIIALLAVSANAQTFPGPFGPPVYSFEWSNASTNGVQDTLKTASDSSLHVFKTPFNIQIVRIDVNATVLVDTGSATPSYAFKVFKRSDYQATPTVVATATLAAKNAQVTGTPSSTSVARITAGSIVQLGAIISTGDKVCGVTVKVWYMRY